MPVTKTNTKRYVAVCGEPGCTWQTGVVSLRLTASERLRSHYRKEHPMRKPEKELPPQEQGERLTDFKECPIVVQKGAVIEPTPDAKFSSEALFSNVWVHTSGEWRDLGRTPIFFRTVQKQVMEDTSDDFGGILIQGVDRNPREWAIVPARNKEEQSILDAWDPSF